MDGQFDPIRLRYRGRDANQGMLDLGQLGQSLEGASRLLGTAGTIVITGQYVKKTPALAVRVKAGPPVIASYGFDALLMTIAPVAAPMFPVIVDVARRAATRAVEAIVTHSIAEAAGKTRVAEKALEVADTALKEMGRTSRSAFDAMERMSTNLRPAVRMFASPVGESCDTAQIGARHESSFVVDREARDVIDAPAPIEIGIETGFEVLISELDLKTRSCKLSLRDDDEPDRRIPGEIIDPLINVPENPYAKAFSAKRWLEVKGKPQLIDGDIEKLFISNVAT